MKLKIREIISNVIVLTLLFGFLLLIVLFCFSIVRFMEIDPTKKDYCTYFYGTSEYNDNLCVIVYNDSSVDFKHIPNFIEMRDVCEVPGFWELSKWNNKCSSFAKGVREKSNV